MVDIARFRATPDVFADKFSDLDRALGAYQNAYPCPPQVGQLLKAFRHHTRQIFFRLHSLIFGAQDFTRQMLSALDLLETDPYIPGHTKALKRLGKEAEDLTSTSLAARTLLKDMKEEILQIIRDVRILLDQGRFPLYIYYKTKQTKHPRNPARRCNLFQCAELKDRKGLR